MHIERGDQRQYYQQEASRTNIGDMAQLVNEGLNTGMSITQKANEATLANNQIQLANDFYVKNNEINTKYQADPDNPEREVELQEAFEELANSYDVNPLCQGQWHTIKNNVYNNFKTRNTQWAEQQKDTNAVLNLQNAYKTSLDQFSMLGRDGTTMEDIRLLYANNEQSMYNGSIGRLGEIRVREALKNYKHDTMVSYITGVATRNPLEAEALLHDESVINDLGNVETIEQLRAVTTKAITGYKDKLAVQDMASALRTLSSAEALEMLSGNANFAKVRNFVDNTKGLTEQAKINILSNYGIDTKMDYFYNGSTGKIELKERSGSGSGTGIKLTDEQKKYTAQVLENDLHDLLEFSANEGEVQNVKNVKKNKSQKEAQNKVVGYMKRIADMQARIDTAYNAKAIGEKERERLMNTYIAPATDFLEANLQQLDEGHIWGAKLGYEQIKKHFSTDGIKDKNQIKDIQKQKLFAQNYYLDELHKVVQNSGGAMQSVYDIESLKPHQQREIYKTASENALKRAKRWTDKPEFFFAKEFPEVYSEPFIMFKQDKALQINKNVAEAVYKREFETNAEGEVADLKDFANSKMREEIIKEAKSNRIKANGTLFPQEQRVTLQAPDPKSYQELESKLKEMGYTINDFHNFAVENGYVQPMNNNQWRQGGYLNPWYMRAYRDLRYADALKKNKK